MIVAAVWTKTGEKTEIKTDWNRFTGNSIVSRLLIYTHAFWRVESPILRTNSNHHPQNKQFTNRILSNSVLRSTLNECASVKTSCSYLLTWPTSLHITLLLVCWKVHEFTWGFLCYGGSQKPPLVFESAWDFQVKIQFAATSSNFPHFLAHVPIHSQKLWCWKCIGFFHFATVGSTFDHPVAGSPELWHSISDLGIFNLDIPSM